jgi:hypothetical protein
MASGSVPLSLIPCHSTGLTKLIIVAYYSPGSIETLNEVTSVPELRGITPPLSVPPTGLFTKARNDKNRNNLPSGGHKPSSSNDSSMTAPNVAGNIGVASGPDYGKVDASGSEYGSGLGETGSGGSGALGRFRAFTQEMSTENGILPSHPQSHGHHQPFSSSLGGYALGGHTRQGSVENGGPHMNRPIPAQQPYGQPSTGYSTYCPSGVPPQPSPPPVYSLSHSHNGTVTYGDSYGGYGTGCGQNGANSGGYGYNRNRPYSAAGRSATPQLPSTAVVSDPSYDPSRTGGSQSVPSHPSSASISPPPPNTLSQIYPHHRSHSHSYSNGQSHPSSQTSAPVMHYTRPESHPFSTPVQRQALPIRSPAGSPRHRAYSTSEIGCDGGGNDVRSPDGSGAIRMRKGVNGASRSDKPASVSTSPPLEGTARSRYFSPYSRPGNAPAPRQHAAFVPPLSVVRRPGTSGTSFKSGYHSGQFTAEHRYQPPGMPIAHPRLHSLPHPQPYSEPAIPPPPLAATPFYQPPPPPPSQHSNGSPATENGGVNDTAGITAQYGGNNNVDAAPFRPIDYSTSVPETQWLPSIPPIPWRIPISS